MWLNVFVQTVVAGLKGAWRGKSALDLVTCLYGSALYSYSPAYNSHCIWLLGRQVQDKYAIADILRIMPPSNTSSLTYTHAYLPIHIFDFAL